MLENIQQKGDGSAGDNGGNVLLDAIQVDQDVEAMEQQKHNYSDPRSPSKHISANSGMHPDVIAAVGWDAILPDAPDHGICLHSNFLTFFIFIFCLNQRSKQNVK